MEFDRPCYSWALVKNEEVAKRMTKFIELNSIGVSKDSQLRAATILRAVSDSCEHGGDTEEGGNFFEINYHLIGERWNQLREAVKQSGLFSTPEFPAAFCNYSNRIFRTQPGKFVNFLLSVFSSFAIFLPN